MDIAPSASPPPAAEPPRLAFADVDSAGRWMKALPLQGVSQAYEALQGQLQAMASATLPARERATIAELARTQVAHLHTELARRYAGKPQPAVERERAAADQAIALWQGLWEQYSACLKPLLEGDPELQGVKSKLLQRGLYVGKQLVLVYGLARRVPPPSLWQELHAYYRLAELLDCAVTAVSDELMPNAIGISCYSTYTHALLLALADLYSLSVRQIELTDRWLGQWSRKVFPYSRQRETEGPVMLVDLDSPGGLMMAPVAPREPPASTRFGYPSKLVTSVRGRLKRLSTGTTPAELQLGTDLSIDAAVALLNHLDSHWSTVPRIHAHREPQWLELAAGGLPAAYFRVGGRTFDRQDPLGRLTFQGTQHIQTLGALTDYDRFKEEAERDWPFERWQGECDWRTATLTRADDGHYRWYLEQLVVIRDEDRMRLAYVARVAQGPGAKLMLTLRLYPGMPKSIAVRPISTAFSEEPPMPVLQVGESEAEPATLIVGPRVFNASRVLRTVDTGPERMLRLTHLVQRGADFERVAFEESH
ncbi:MAG TPA: hypothetical protein VMV45_04635 [Casimicrobiaceae bacterium]|nr:hypothetical protein [Casimicrobiaceae bacterium]